ncbi:MAG: DUF2726 domain-containing protein [Nitrospirota bacterium]|nr:DUF2726 domain-containing protein [Nitrospirota bacterium]
MDTLVAFLVDHIAPISLAVAALLVVLLLWWATMLLTKLSTRKAERGASIPPGLELTAQPFMTKSEAAFYNVLRLTVQDEYLLFAQVPLWCLVNVNATHPKLRVEFLGQIALKRLDFVLVHPGTLTVAKVIEMEEDPPSTQRQVRNQLVEDTLKAVGIDVVRLTLNRIYTIADLAEALDIEPAE